MPSPGMPGRAEDWRVGGLVVVGLEFGDLRDALAGVAADVEAEVVPGAGRDRNGDGVAAGVEGVGGGGRKGGVGGAVGAAIDLDGLVAGAPVLRELQDDAVDGGCRAEVKGEGGTGGGRLPVGAEVVVVGAGGRVSLEGAAGGEAAALGEVLGSGGVRGDGAGVQGEGQGAVPQVDVVGPVEDP